MDLQTLVGILLLGGASFAGGVWATLYVVFGPSLWWGEGLENNPPPPSG